MRNPWRLLTFRGRVFVVAGVAVGALAALIGQRDVVWIGLLLVLLPFTAAFLVARTRLRLSCERAVVPSQMAIGESAVGRLVLEKTGPIPYGILRFEDYVPRHLGVRPRFTVQTLASHWRREFTYPLQGSVRGRYSTGPLMVRSSDPLGLAQLDRSFHATSEVMVTPRIFPLEEMRNAGGGGATGESRPQRLGVVGQDDVLVREYRHGDDVRRVHWRSTARRGELMVRREEQAFDPSVTVMLDSRASAHGGHGKDSSFEWAVSAAASVAMHFLTDGFELNLLETRGPLTMVGDLSSNQVTTRHNVVHKLTDITTTSEATLRPMIDAALVHQGSQLVVAVLGRLTRGEVEQLERTRHNRAAGLALVVDADSFAIRSERADAEVREEHARAVALLREHRWRVVTADRTRTVTDTWGDLERLGELV
ncbi:DUF58 domain-containing protein [Desertihabitans aurantiacus]|uniref:DUF58 domain-containing protein n=1 Tax=Desertihabitans aurantiacus TaxID=2282477 RepID=UPI000DF73D52|nr:DUF58 domain-containing protein [Desertihabitans aurantiacus]